MKDFRSHLDYLEKEGKLVKVKKQVDTRFEIAAGIRKISDTNGPALLFENIRGYPDWRVAGGIFATKELMALALETDDDEDSILKRHLECDQKSIKPETVSTGPVKDVIIIGDDVDLNALPIPTYCEQDVAPYLTSGIEIAKDPETNIQNCSMIRRMLLDKDRLSLALPPTRDIGMMITAAEQDNQKLGVATVIGAPPALAIASQIKVPMGVDETEIAGAFQGEPLEMVKCETIDVEVPANAEIVVEGVVQPGERVDDGPFGEYPGNYITLNRWCNLGDTLIQSVYVTKVTAITMRRDPIFQALLTGIPITENHILRKWASAAAIYRAISHVMLRIEDIKGINLTPGGTGCYHAVISIKKRTESTPRDIIYTVLSMRILAGMVTVVDEDIDIYDPKDVEWAVATRVHPENDVIILPSVSSTEGSPQTASHRHRWGIDATKPTGEYISSYDRAIPPGVEKVDYV